MPLYVPGERAIVVRRLTAADENPDKLVRFFAASWDGWYNGELDAQLDVPRIATPGKPEHTARERQNLLDGSNVYWAAIDSTSEPGPSIVGLAWLSIAESGVVLEEWNTFPPQYRGRGIGAAALAAAAKHLATQGVLQGPLSLEVYATSPVVQLYSEEWGLQVVGEKHYDHVGSGVPQLEMTGEIDGMVGWLASKQRLAYEA